MLENIRSYFELSPFAIRIIFQHIDLYDGGIQINEFHLQHVLLKYYMSDSHTLIV